MQDERRELSDAELEALKALWSIGPSQVREVMEALRAGGRDWAYTTAKTILDRLEAKGYARRDRSEAAHIYHPTVTRDDLARLRVGELRAELYDGAAAPLVRALVEGGLSPDEVRSLRASLDALERGVSR
ncbi:MAG TPA: BlaI/MecI/CopY family transcriptional regulator [Longimicrobiales bacterium]|nr:BlaI/MecI/CopY family transcriptional regulator [Longimicrobiales bacterium]